MVFEKFVKIIRKNEKNVSSPLTLDSNGIFSLESLKNIYLNNNKIKVFRVYQNRMSSVEALWLSYNKIRHLDNSVCILYSLRYLHIDHNRISTIPVNLCLCSEISGLWIGYNHLKALPKKLLEMKKLKILDVEFNKIDEIPDVIRRFSEELVIHTQGQML